MIVKEYSQSFGKIKNIYCYFQSQVIEFQWNDIKAYDVEEEGMSFAFEYNRPGKRPRMVQILTQYVSCQDDIRQHF